MNKARLYGGASSGRLVTLTLLASLLASCTSAGDSQFSMQAPALAGGNAAVAAADTEMGEAARQAQPTDQTDFAAASGDEAAPKLVSKPEVSSAAEAASGDAEAKVQLASASASSANSGGEAVDALNSAPSGPQALASATPPNLIDGKKRAFLSSFFGNQAAAAKPSPAAAPLLPEKSPLGEKSEAKNSQKARPLIKLASAGGDDMRSASAAFALDGDDNDLPGVRQTMLFEIKRKSGIDDESDVDVHEEDDLGPIRVASAAGMARLAPNGLLKQTETVDTACLKPALVRTLKKAEAYFGKRLILTSGYRSPSYNRQVNGAKRSMHMYCAAADVQMPGVSKWELANYFRAQPERGGVGTYCSTESIHVDIGPERDWNWKCGRRRG